MKKKLPLGFVIGLLCLALAAGGLFGFLIVRARYNRMLGALPEKMQRYAVLDELDSIIAENYYGSSAGKTLRSAIAKGYVSGLSDQDSKYLTKDEYAAYLAESAGEMDGIGVSCRKTENGTLRVDEVFDGSPAQQAGMQAGDLIAAVDGIAVNASNADDMLLLLESDKKSTVTITFQNNKDEKTAELTKGYEAPSVSHALIGTVGYLKISDFYASSAEQVEEAINVLQTSGAVSLVIDLRKNSSANFENAMDTLDVFVPMNRETPAATLVDRQKKVLQTYDTKAGEINLPMAVLISGSTKGAAELFACNLRDFGKAQLVGTKTGGNALASKVFHLSGGDALLLCVGEMLPYQSESFHGVGLVPDLESVLKEKTNNPETDSQFLAAAALISPAA